MQEVVTQVSDLLRERHRLDRLNKPDDFTIQTQVELLEAQKETTGTFTSLIPVLQVSHCLSEGSGYWQSC
jgi:hypothetical protein